MNFFPEQNMKTTIQTVSLAALIATTVITTNAADIDVPADYTTIQAAVDAASSGDTIHIAPGIYKEQTWIIKKNLTLVGEPGTILRAFPGMQPGLPGVVDSHCVIFISNSSDVIIRNLTFEGDQLADQNDVELRGVDFDVSGGAVENCRFTGFREATPGSKFATAVVFWNGLSGADLLNVRADGNTIEDSYAGIWVAGAHDKISYNFTIENNTIRGVATSTTPDQNRRGMELSDGITGFVTGNSIGGFSYTGTGSQYPHAWGIIALGNGPSLDQTRPLDFMRFENNTFRDNNQHLMLIRAKGHEIVNNHFEGTGQGERPSGLWFSGENVLVQGNVFRDMEEGIRVGGEDPTYGTQLGFATNATLVDNRFCNVTNMVNLQPQATATETGRETCPFAPPVLNILSWPGIEEGFVVEAAATPNGPWSTLDATPVLQNGQNSVVVEAVTNQQFFRLAKP